MKDLFNISKLSLIEPAKGLILISEPFNDDKYFHRSVVCLCEHNEEGSFGYVVNNLMDVKLSDLLPAIKNDDFKVGLGGPMSPKNVYYIHTLGDEIEGSVKVREGLYTGGDFKQIVTLINTGLINHSEIQFFLGYSGWSNGQLNEEINRGSWIVSEFEIKNLMKNSSNHFWKNTLKEKGGKYKTIANFPLDPSLN